MLWVFFQSLLKHNPNLSVYLKNVKKYFKIPIAVGFGISKKEHIETLVSHADIAVVGSALIDVIKLSNRKRLNQDVKNFINSIKV